MKNKQDLSRRNFIRNSVMAGGAVLLSGVLPSHAQTPIFSAAENSDSPEADELLRGVSDIHLHAAPDSKARLGNELEFARAACDVGYKSMLFKSNDFSCHDRAYLIRQELQGSEVFGSLCMNRVHGDKVNVFAVEKAVATTGIFVVVSGCRHRMPFTRISAITARKRVCPLWTITGVCCLKSCESWRYVPKRIHFRNGALFVRGEHHAGSESREVGVRKCVVTHANSGIWKMTHDQIKRCIDLGAWMEYSYITNLWGPGTGLPDFERMSDKEFADFARIAPQRSIITTDLGQVGMPHPVDGMRRCILALLENGLAQKQVDFMVRSNPAQLVGLSVSE